MCKASRRALSSGEARAPALYPAAGMNKFFLPTSRKVLPTFQTFCPVGVLIAQTLVHFAHFRVQARKRVFWGGLEGVLWMYISPKGVCDC